MAVQVTLDASVRRIQDSSLGKQGQVLLGRKGTRIESWVLVTLPPVPLEAMKLLVASFRCLGWGEPPRSLWDVRKLSGNLESILLSTTEGSSPAEC